MEKSPVKGKKRDRVVQTYITGVYVDMFVYCVLNQVLANLLHVYSTILFMKLHTKDFCFCKTMY